MMPYSEARIDRVAETVNDFCAAMKIGRTFFYKEVKRGRIKILKAGRKTLVPIAQRQAYLQLLTEEAGR